MISGTAEYRDGGRGSFSFGKFSTLKKMMIEERNLRKVWIFKEIKKLDCQIRTIATPTRDINKFVVEVGLFESLGEQGGDIITFTYKEFPTQKEIKQDVEENLKEIYEDLKDCSLCHREETQLKVLRRVFK